MFFNKDAKKRKKTDTSSVSLDVFHQKKLEEFKNKTTTLNQNIEKKRIVDQEIADLLEYDTFDADELDKLSKLRTETQTLANEIEKLSSNHHKMDYYYHASSVLEEYYKEDSTQIKSQMDISDLIKRKKNSSNSNKAQLLNTYLDAIDENPNSSTRQNFMNCEDCNLEMMLDKTNSMFVCLECGIIENLSSFGEGKNNTSSTSDITKFSIYQRKNHFREWLNQLQARETTDIPDEVYDMIILELDKMRFVNLANLSPAIMRKILKKLNLSKYYENIFYIINKLNKLPPPTLTREQEDNLISMFKQIEEPFQLFKSAKRKNILRYSYLLFKMCELLEYDEFLWCFKLLKNRNKLIQQDEIWKKICEHNGWEFIASI
uniref:VLTF3-like protein n=1 Tax=Megaviridae environmental sample TaxID=1737588 RepID=A0A5J6VIX6_9VIRU|nr:MAG: VLTF3-like protein [Megaviridae environmental sample]